MSKDIDMLIVLDTTLIKERYLEPSLDKDNPTALHEECQYFIMSGMKPDYFHVPGKHGYFLSLDLDPGDEVSFRAISLQQNGDDAILLYGVHRLTGDEIFNEFSNDVVKRDHAVMPNENHVLPADTYRGNFISFDTVVEDKGMGTYHFYCALYVANQGHTEQNIYGYFYWPMGIAIWE